MNQEHDTTAQRVPEPVSVMVFSPSNPDYEKVNFQENFGRHRGNPSKFYDGMLTEYNAAEVGAILVFPMHMKYQLSNICKVLETRGIIASFDFAVTRMMTDAGGNPYPKGVEPLKVKKLSNRVAAMTIGALKKSQVDALRAQLLQERLAAQEVADAE